MRRIAIAIVMLLAAAFQGMGQSAPPKQKSASTIGPEYKDPTDGVVKPVVKCTGRSGKPCTEQEVKDVNTGSYSGKRMHEHVTISLIASDGSAKCEQVGGKPCTPDQIQYLTQIAVEQKMAIKGAGVPQDTAPPAARKQ